MLLHSCCCLLLPAAAAAAGGTTYQHCAMHPRSTCAQRGPLLGSFHLCTAAGQLSHASPAYEPAARAHSTRGGLGCLSAQLFPQAGRTQRYQPHRHVHCGTILIAAVRASCCCLLLLLLRYPQSPLCHASKQQLLTEHSAAGQQHDVQHCFTW
jgi:hypothetical protein